uniref:C2H2-type domain-containing protein n=1 Tax=Trichuris muris TaxID=70415 RepID=A0A5S6R5B1_TRIMR
MPADCLLPSRIRRHTRTGTRTSVRRAPCYYYYYLPSAKQKLLAKSRCIDSPPLETVSCALPPSERIELQQRLSAHIRAHVYYTHTHTHRWRDAQSSGEDGQEIREVEWDNCRARKGSGLRRLANSCRTRTNDSVIRRRPSKTASGGEPSPSVGYWRVRACVHAPAINQSSNRLPPFNRRSPKARRPLEHDDTSPHLVTVHRATLPDDYRNRQWRHNRAPVVLIALSSAPVLSVPTAASGGSSVLSISHYSSILVRKLDGCHCGQVYSCDMVGYGRHRRRSAGKVRQLSTRTAKLSLRLRFSPAKLKWDPHPRGRSPTLACADRFGRFEHLRLAIPSSRRYVYNTCTCIIAELVVLSTALATLPTSFTSARGSRRHSQPPFTWAHKTETRIHNPEGSLRSPGK